MATECSKFDWDLKRAVIVVLRHLKIDGDDNQQTLADTF